MSGSGYGYGYGYGYGEEPSAIVEATSSSDCHYELMALARVLAEGLGLTADGEDRTAYLSDVAQSIEGWRCESYDFLATMTSTLGEMKGELAQMRAIMQAGYDASEAIRQEAQAVLDATAQAAQNYMREVQAEPAPDYYPFASLPAGTTARDLADGGRLFGLASGDQIRVDADGTIVFIGADGQAQLAGAPQGRQVTLPNGMTFTLRAEAVRVTHEAALIEGLPWDAVPEQVAEARYSVTLSDGTRLVANHAACSATIMSPAGTALLLSLARVEGIGEDVETRLIAGGAKSFATAESGHRGVIESNGTIHLGLSSGLDLVIRFPQDASGGGAGGDGTDCGGACGINCQERAQ